eukprot:TRINITY_DN3244_c2_g2_i1.p1 TRINITY_DN3244_c2_g2~~TRINITY_DN3244_c2_g2_i1.p1  ORF type:complete len:663 (+),score=171.31 TRINITY_DN3244_c2_g2_i1:118-2106(+)
MESKRIKVAFEVHQEKKIFSTTEDGKETVVVETTSGEKFAQLVSQIDFEHLQKEKTESDDSESKLKVVKKPPPDPNRAWAWSSVADSLYYARIETEQMVLLLDMLQNGQYLSAYNIPKANPPISLRVENLVVAKKTKQRELMNVSNLFHQAAQNLQKVVTREKTYFEDLLQIRQQWLLSSKLVEKKQPGSARYASRQIGRIFIDYGYKCAGSKLKSKAEISQLPSGKVSIHLPSTEQKSLMIFTSDGMEYSDRLESLKPDSKEPKVNHDICNAQRSQFLNELFQQMSFDLEARDVDGVEIFQNHFVIGLDMDRNITIQLVTPKEEEEKSRQIKASKKPSAITSTMPSTSFAVIELMLHQLLRQYHLNSFKQIDEKVKIREGNRRREILEKLRDFYIHRDLAQDIEKMVHQICMNFPRAHLHRNQTESCFVTCFEITYGTRFSLQIIIEKRHFKVGGARFCIQISTVESLRRYLLTTLVRHVLDETHRESLALGCKGRSENFSLIFDQHHHKAITVTLNPIPLENRVDLEVTEVTSSTRATQKVKWEDVEGDNVESKLKHIYLNGLAALTPTLSKSSKSFDSASPAFGSQKSASFLLRSSKSNRDEMGSPYRKNGFHPDDNNNDQKSKKKRHREDEIQLCLNEESKEYGTDIPLATPESDADY